MTSSTDETDFIRQTLESEMSRVEQVIGLLWFQVVDAPGTEVEVSALLRILEANGMPTQSRTRIRNALTKSKFVSRAQRAGFVRLVQRYVPELSERFGEFAAKKTPLIKSEYLPIALLPSRRYYAEVVLQINGCYEYRFFDGAATMIRRVIEGLLIDVYTQQGRLDEIKVGSEIMMLDGILRVFAADTKLHKARGLVKNLASIKGIGDRAAHSRTYLTDKHDLDDIKVSLKTSVAELSSMIGSAS